jgi:hypothetical protein
MRGIRRTHGSAKVRKAPAVAGKMLGMVATAPDKLAGLRDRALLLIGFGGALRRSEPEEENIINIKKNMLPPPSPAGFDDWYAIYPRKKQPQDAKRAFAKLMASGVITLDALMVKTRTFADNWQNEPKDRRKFIPYPASWLNAGGYFDEPDDGAEPAPAAIDPRSFTDDKWQRCLKYFSDTETWVANAWGPKPGEPGCLVPSHLLLAPVSNSKGAA